MDAPAAVGGPGGLYQASVYPTVHTGAIGLALSAGAKAQNLPESQYGMASVAFHFFNQYQAEGRVRLFEGCGGYGDGEQRRDFVSVDDVVKVNMYFLDHPDLSGIYNLGTGRAQSFNDVALAVVNACRTARDDEPLTLEQMRSQGIVQYIAFPEALKGKYQSFTQADLTALREAGYDAPFDDVQTGVARYCQQRLAQG